MLSLFYLSAFFFLVGKKKKTVGEKKKIKQLKKERYDLPKIIRNITN